MARSAVAKEDVSPCLEEAPPLPSRLEEASAARPTPWSGTADLLAHPADDLATARMFVLAALAGLAFWVLLAVLVI